MTQIAPTEKNQQIQVIGADSDLSPEQAQECWGYWNRELHESSSVYHCFL